MFFMIFSTGVPSVHPSEIFGKTERKIGKFKPFLRPARYTLKSEPEAQKLLKQRVLQSELGEGVNYK